MLSELVLVHRTSNAPWMGEGVVWKTCLRQVFLGHRTRFESLLALPSDEIYFGEDAYRFLLEIVCGLHSRVLGENEIVSQFKQRFLSMELPRDFTDVFSNLAPSLLADMKQIRRSHALNSGAHSYGSYCRKEAENCARVTVLGTGELARSILPWFARKASVRVIHRSGARSEKGLTALVAQLAETNADLARRLEFSPVESAHPDFSGALIIAAPIPAREIEAMLAHAATLPGYLAPTKLIDLRGEATGDPILPITLADASDLPIFDLQDFFREAETSNRAASLAREAALARAAKLAESRLESESILIRTQGWEDLCG